MVYGWGRQGEVLSCHAISAILITFFPHCVLIARRGYHSSLREAFSMICFFCPGVIFLMSTPMPGMVMFFPQGWRHRISPQIGVLSSNSLMTNQTSDEEDQSSQDNKKHPSFDTLRVMPRWVRARSMSCARLIRTLK